MTREEFIKLAKSEGYGYDDNDIKDMLSLLSDEKPFQNLRVTMRELSYRMAGVSTEEEWLDYFAKNFLLHY